MTDTTNDARTDSRILSFSLKAGGFFAAAMLGNLGLAVALVLVGFWVDWLDG